jgi:hypothetical protein
MVKNTGEPGGGPFWVENDGGEKSLQIVETAQIDPDDPRQQAMLTHATHFNPVDLVCGVRDWQGNPFDLRKFVDPSTVFHFFEIERRKGAQGPGASGTLERVHGPLDYPICGSAGHYL